MTAGCDTCSCYRRHADIRECVAYLKRVLRQKEEQVLYLNRKLLLLTPPEGDEETQ